MRKFFSLFHSLWAQCSRYFSRSYVTCIVHDELPEQLRQKTLYVVYDEGFLWHTSMLCPCGCNDTIHLNMIADEKPCWRMERHNNGTVSLAPSIWRTKGCRSHFFVRRGKIIWCKEHAFIRNSY